MKKIIYLLLIVASFGMNITYPENVDVIRINSNQCISLFFLIWVGCLFYMVKKNKINIQIKSVWIFGFILSVIYNATFIANNLSDSAYLTGLVNILLTMFALFSWTIIFSLTLSVIQKYFGFNIVNWHTPKTIYIWLILVIIWIISIAGFLPGQISWDGVRQFCEFERTKIAYLNFKYIPTNHHPWFTTIIFGTLFNVGRSLFGVNFGIFSVVLFQFIISSVIYTFVIKYVFEKTGKYGGIGAFILFASPIFSSYAITIDKSTLYYAFAAWFYLMFTKIFEKIKISQLKWDDILYYCLASSLFGLFRNDSFFIVIIATVVLIFLSISKKRNLMLIMVSIFVILGIHFGWNSYLNLKNVVKSSPSEALTLPTRQLSYIYLHDKNSLTKNELKIINRITPLSKISQNFDINNGDNLKSLYPSNTFLNSDQIISDVKKHKKTIRTTNTEKREISQYLAVWLKEGINHPFKYVYVYLGANSCYLNPFIRYSDGLFLNYFPGPETHPYMAPSWSKQYTPVFNEKIRDIYRKAMLFIVNSPLLMFISNPAFPIWSTLILFCVLFELRKKVNLMLLLPLAVMCLLFTITSINGYTRYTIGVLAVLPIVISYLWRDRYNDKFCKVK